MKNQMISKLISESAIRCRIKNCIWDKSQNFHNCNGFRRRLKLLIKIILRRGTSKFQYFPIVMPTTFSKFKKLKRRVLRTMWEENKTQLKIEIASLSALVSSELSVFLIIFWVFQNFSIFQEFWKFRKVPDHPKSSFFMFWRYWDHFQMILDQIKILQNFHQNFDFWPKFSSRTQKLKNQMISELIFGSAFRSRIKNCVLN